MVEPRRTGRRGSGSRPQIGPTRAAKPRAPRAPPALTARAVAVVAQTHNPADAVTMLKRPPTRIELKPEDREEYQRHKKERQPTPAADDAKEKKAADKDARLGLKAAR